MMIEWIPGFQSYLGSASWQVGVLVAVIWGLSKLTRGAPAKWHYFLWLLVLAKVYLPSDLSSPLSARALLGQTSWETSQTTSKRGSIAFTSESFDLAEGNQSQDRAVPSSPVSDPSTALLPLAAESSRIAWPTGIWMVGVILYATMLVWSSRKHRAFPNTIDELPKTVAGVWQDLGLRKKVPKRAQLLVADCRGGPYVTGLLNPRIVLPQSLAERGNITEIRLAIAHELEHVRRRDVVWNAFIYVAKAIFWFHPLVHYGLRRFCEAREILIDGRVLREEGESSKDAYGELILSVLQARTWRLFPASGMSTSSLAGLKERIRRIGEFDPTRCRLRVRHLVGLLLMAVAVVPMGAWRIAAQQKESSEKSSRSESTIPEAAEGEDSKPVPGESPGSFDPHPIVEIEARLIELD